MNASRTSPHEVRRHKPSPQSSCCRCSPHWETLVPHLTKLGRVTLLAYPVQAELDQVLNRLLVSCEHFELLLMANQYPLHPGGILRCTTHGMAVIGNRFSLLSSNCRVGVLHSSESDPRIILISIAALLER